MAIVQISKIQHRSGNIVDLPQLDEAELGFASDAKRLFIGKVAPNENIEVLTSYSNISFSQLDGAVGNLDISAVSVDDGQVLTYDGTNWVNRGGDAGGLIDLGDVGNVKIAGGAIGYVLETDGTGNLSWTPKATLVSMIQSVSNANPAVVTTVDENFFTDSAEITFTNLPGAAGSVGYVLNGQTLFANILTSNTFSLYTDVALTIAYDATSNTAFPSTTATDTSASNNRVTVTSSAAFSLNDAIKFKGTMFGVLNDETTYYVKAKPTGTTITLSLTAGGTELTLTTASGSCTVYAIGGRAISTVGAAGTTLIAAGANTSVQFNLSGTLTGSSDLTWNSGVSPSVLSVNGNSNVGNLNATTLVSASILSSNIATGTAPLTVTSTTRVANLNVAYANVADHINTALVTTGTYYPLLANATSGNVADGANANLAFNAATGNLSATILNSNSTITATGNITGGNMHTAGTVTASRLISNVATGTAPVTVSSTTRVANLNVDYANVSDFNVVTTQNTGTFYPVFVNSSSTGNLALGSNSSISFDAATGNLSTSRLNATLITGTLTTAAQPNVTSLGTLTSLSVSGTVTANDISTFGTAGDTLNISGAGNTNVNGAGGAINIGSANGNGTGAGGNLTLAAGQANSSGNAAGGIASLRAGNGYGQGAGGNVAIYSGDSSNTYGGLGGNLIITGGTYDGLGGDVTLSAGEAKGLDAIGGDIVVKTGPSTGAAITGKIIFQTSTPGSSGNSVQVLANRVLIDDSEVNIVMTTDATSTATGALQVAGGVGVAGNVYANLFYGNGFGITYIAGGNVTGAVASATTATSATTAGTVTTNAQPNITSVGTLTTLVVSSPSLTAITPFTLDQTWNNASVSFTGIRQNITDVSSQSSSLLLDLQNNGISQFSVQKDGYANAFVLITRATTGTAPLQVSSTTKVTNLNADLLDGFNADSTNTSSTVVARDVNGSFAANVITAVLFSGTLSTASQPNVTSVSSSFTNLTFANAQSITGNNLSLTTGSSSNPGTITGNWTLSGGSRLQATYADLAEYYEGDQSYDPGTVLEFGGDKEVTLASDGTNRVAGIVSTDPAYAMNAKCPGIAVAIALQGRVPCKVRGTIRKGDMLVSAGNGYARPSTTPTIGSVIGKALQDFNGPEGIVEVAVGRL